MTRYLPLFALALVACSDAQAGSLRQYRGGSSVHVSGPFADAEVFEDAAADAGPSDAGFTNAKSWDFDGTDERATLADNASIDSNRTAMSWSAWVKLDTLATSDSFVSKFQTGQQSWRFQMSEADNDEIELFAETTSILCRSTAANLTTGTWYHVGAIYDGSLTGASGGGTNSNRAKLCLNGVELSTRVCSGTWPATLADTTASVEVGARNAAGFIDGNLDEIAIYAQAFADCAALYAAVSSSDKPKDLTGSGTLLAWWSMGDDPDSTGSIVDRSGNNNALTPANAESGDLEADVP